MMMSSRTSVVSVNGPPRSLLYHYLTNPTGWTFPATCRRGRDARAAHLRGLESRDRARTRRWWSDEFDADGVRSVAIFASSLDNYWRAIPLGEGLRDEVRLSRDLYLAPLVPVVGRGDGALVAVVGREKGQVFRLR